MAYATHQNLIDRFGEAELIQLTDRADPPAGAIDTAVLDEALADAAAEIDAYLSGRYALPLAVVPPHLERMACDIARYYLYGDRVTEVVTRRFDDALRYLREVGAGRLSLGAEVPGAEVSAAGAPQVAAPGRVFTRGDGETPGSLDDY